MAVELVNYSVIYSEYDSLVLRVGYQSYIYIDNHYIFVMPEIKL